jgi:hypothetical protein
MFAFKHKVGGFGLLDTLQSDRGRSTGPISLHKALELRLYGVLRSSSDGLLGRTLTRIPSKLSV